MKEQTELPGMERHVELAAKLNIAPEAVLTIQAALKIYYETASARAEMSKKESRLKIEAFATLRAHGLNSFLYWNSELDGYQEVDIETIEKLVFSKEIQHGEPPGEGVEEENDPGPSEGLLADAAAAQKKKNVAENDEGDVTVPDTAAPKSKAKKKGKGK